jgi:protein involved in polysaccharide export with SLBB domain
VSLRSVIFSLFEWMAWLKGMMSKLTALFAALLLSFSLGAHAEGMSDYRMSVGDLIKIQVYGEEELSPELRLSDAGTISYPFLGELAALGLTTGELSQLLSTRLADGYLVDPSVNVTILEYREFYIDGAVNKPGGYPYQPGLTLQRAVSLAGGFTERASSSKFFVVREGAGNEPNRLDLNSPVQPGDVITIDESFF